MNNKEYEQKKRECWEKVKFALHTPNTDRPVFDFIFDRAYALGKQTEIISQEEIEKAWQDYAEEIGLPESLNYATRSMIEIAIKQAFKSGANFSLGKQEKDADTSLWNRLTDEEKREMQCRYHTNECVLHDHRMRTGDKAQSKAVARMKLLENLFGKENLKSENK